MTGLNDTASWSPLSRGGFVVLVVLFTVLWFGQLDIRHLIANDEGRLAEIAREMWVGHHWLTPSYNGYAYVEQPPLPLWMTALTYCGFGVGDWQARLWTAISGFGAVLMVGYTGTRIFHRTAGFFAATVLASSPYWNLFGHFSSPDMGLAFMMTLTLCTLLLAQHPDAQKARIQRAALHADAGDGLGRNGRPRRMWRARPMPPWRAGGTTRRWMALCWASMAFAVLSKGIVGLALPAMIVVVYSLVLRDGALWRRLYLFSGAVIFLLITAPWLWLLASRHPGTLRRFLVDAPLHDFLTRDAHPPGGLFYFVPVVLIGFLPWLSLVGQSVWQAARLPRQTNRFSPNGFICVWVACIFVFFSVSQSQLVAYVLPLAPALALLIGQCLPGISRMQWQRHLTGYALLIVAAGVGVVYLSNFGEATNPNVLYRQFQTWIWLALLVGLLGIGLAALLNRAARRERTSPGTIPAPLPDTVAGAPSMIVFAMTWLLMVGIAGNAHEIFGRVSSGALLAPAVKAALADLPADTPFYAVDVLDHTLPFYISHTMIMVRRRDELAYGLDRAPDQWIPTVAQWSRIWRTQRTALALMSPQRYKAFVAQGLPMTLIASDARRVIVSRSEWRPNGGLH